MTTNTFESYYIEDIKYEHNADGTTRFSIQIAKGPGAKPVFGGAKVQVDVTIDSLGNEGT